MPSTIMIHGTSPLQKKITVNQQTNIYIPTRPERSVLFNQPTQLLCFITGTTSQPAALTPSSSEPRQVHTGAATCLTAATTLHANHSFISPSNNTQLRFAATHANIRINISLTFAESRCGLDILLHWHLQ